MCSCFSFILSNLRQFFHRSILRFRKDALNFRGVIQSHSNADEVFQGNESLLFKSHNIT